MHSNNNWNLSFCTVQQEPNYKPICRCRHIKSSFRKEISCCYNLKAKTLRNALLTSREEWGLMVPFCFVCTSIQSHLYKISPCGCKTCSLHVPAWMKCAIIPLLFPPTVPSPITGHLFIHSWPEESLSHLMWWWRQVSSALWMVSCRDTTCCTVPSLMMNGQLTIAIKLVGARFILYFKNFHFFKYERLNESHPFRFTAVLHWNGHQYTQWLYSSQLEKTRGGSLQDSCR